VNSTGAIVGYVGVPHGVELRVDLMFCENIGVARRRSAGEDLHPGAAVAGGLRTPRWLATGGGVDDHGLRLASFRGARPGTDVTPLLPASRSFGDHRPLKHATPINIADA
jgi:hypothetical protein